MRKDEKMGFKCCTFLVVLTLLLECSSERRYLPGELIFEKKLDTWGYHQLMDPRIIGQDSVLFSEYLSEEQSGMWLYLLNLKTGDAQELTFEKISNPDYADFSSGILVACTETFGPIEVMFPDGHSEWVDGIHPSFNDDGTAFVYEHLGDIFIYDLKTKKSRLLYDQGPFNHSPDWDGGTIYFYQQMYSDEKESYIQSMHASGGEVTDLTDGTYSDHFPRADQECVAFVRIVEDPDNPEDQERYVVVHQGKEQIHSVRADATTCDIMGDYIVYTYSNQLYRYKWR